MKSRRRRESARGLTRLSAISAISSAVLLVSTTPASASGFCNGSFEDPSGPQPGDFAEIVAPSAIIPCWFVNAGAIDVVSNFNYKASQGTFAVDLSGTPTAGAIEQTFSTVVGTEYLVAFDFAGNPNGDPGIKHMRVSAAGQSQDFSFDTTNKTPAHPGWVREFWSFTATGTSTTLEFSSLELQVPTDYGPTIDNIEVTPEPSTLALLSLALVALARRARPMTPPRPVGHISRETFG